MPYGLEQNDALVKYPYTLKDFKADNPGVSPPNNMDALADWGVVAVADAGTKPQPSDPALFKVVRGDPVKVNGSWTEQWVEQALTPEEQAAYQEVAAAKEVEEATRADAFFQNFRAMNAQQVQNYVNNNTQNIADVRALLSKMALILLAISKRGI